MLTDWTMTEIAKTKLCVPVNNSWLGLMYTDRTFFERPINEAAIRRIRQILDKEA